MARIDTGTGVFGTICSFGLGILPEFTDLEKLEIVFWFQVFAFTVTIVVGIMTTMNITIKMIDRFKGKKTEGE